jgi:hypothetical protein
VHPSRYVMALAEVFRPARAAYPREWVGLVWKVRLDGSEISLHAAWWIQGFEIWSVGAYSDEPWVMFDTQRTRSTDWHPDLPPPKRTDAHRGGGSAFRQVAWPSEWYVPGSECVQDHQDEQLCVGAKETGVLCNHGGGWKAQHAPVELDLTAPYVCGVYWEGLSSVAFPVNAVPLAYGNSTWPRPGCTEGFWIPARPRLRGPEPGIVYMEA